ncbi:hypothetical protein HKD37_14G039583 [Glycine soja]
MPPKKMEAKVATLENEVVSIKDVLQVLNLKVDVNQEKLINRRRWRRHVRGEDHVGDDDRKFQNSGLKKLQGEPLDEFHQSVKKVELLLQLKVELIKHYGGIIEGDMVEQLASLQQLGSVEEYIQEFKHLTSQWSTSYKNDEEVHYGAVGLGTILDRVPLTAPIHIICLAQMQWAASVTLGPGVWRTNLLSTEVVVCAQSQKEVFTSENNVVRCAVFTLPQRFVPISPNAPKDCGKVSLLSLLQRTKN